MFFKITNYIKGYVSVLIEGLFPERFINLCTNNKINLWNIHRKSKSAITADMGISDFKKIRKFIKPSKCKVRIVKKYGVRFFIYRHRHRKALVAGLAVFFILLWGLTQFVWIIEITGNEKISRESILEYAQKGGLKTGMLAGSVNSQNVQNYMMTNMENLAFVTVNRTGTTVNIDIREKEEQREHFDKNAPSNIIATQSGVIESVLVQSGTASVKKGDVVYKGQLLVSGASDNKYLGIKYSNSDALVKARVWHEKTVDLPYYIEEKMPTGEIKNKRKLKFFDFSLNLFIKNKILFEKYDILSYTNYISLGDGKVLPIGIETTRYNEYKILRTKLTDKQAKEVLLAEFNEKYKDSEIISRTFETKDNKMTVIFECIEEIGREEEFNDNREILGS